jgi:hypothetical protein
MAVSSFVADSSLPKSPFLACEVAILGGFEMMFTKRPPGKDSGGPFFECPHNSQRGQFQVQSYGIPPTFGVFP